MRGGQLANVVKSGRYGPFQSPRRTEVRPSVLSPAGPPSMIAETRGRCEAGSVLTQRTALGVPDLARPGQERSPGAVQEQMVPEKKREYWADFLKSAPVVLVLCVDRKRSYGRWIENGTIAATYILLPAAALNLGATFMTAYNLKRPGQLRELRRLLAIPRYFALTM